MSVRVLFFVAVSASFLAFLSLVEGSRYRIVSGRKADAEEFPYQADLERLTMHWCGGSVIDKNFILTAAHCVKSYESLQPVPDYILRVRVGNDITGTGGIIHSVSKIITHENYTDYAEMDQFDIALVKVEKPIEFSDKVKAVKLISKAPAPGTLGWVSGFGKQEIMRRSGGVKRHLMAVKLPVVSLEECRKTLKHVADDMICAGYKKGHRDSCTGDSGGPFVVGNKVAGIVAWGVGCGREGLPGVYTNVAHYKNWIKSNMEENQ